MAEAGLDSSDAAGVGWGETDSDCMSGKTWLESLEGVRRGYGARGRENISRAESTDDTRS